MITADHVRAAHEAAIASMDASQRAAMARELDAHSIMQSTPPARDKRLARIFVCEAARANAAA